MTESFGLLLCDDLLFSSQICGQANALGLNLRCVKTSAELLRISLEIRPRCVIVDVNTPGLAIDDFVHQLAGLEPRPFIVGYGSHVDAVSLKKARDAGCDVVWPRSKFAAELAASLPGWFKASEAKS